MMFKRPQCKGKIDLTKFNIETYLNKLGVVYNPYTDLSSRERKYHCPFCGDKSQDKYHCYVNLETTQFYCHWCSKSGNAITFIKELETDLGPGGWKQVLRKYNIGQAKQYAQNDFEEHMGQLPEFFEVLTSDPLPHYLRNKRFTLAHIKPYDVGVCKFGKLKGRVVFPICLNSELISYIAKTDMTGLPRSYTLCKTSKLLYNYDVAKRHNTVVLVESVTDVIATGSFSMALFGKHLSNAQLNLIIQGRFDKVIVCLDSDAHLYTMDVAKRLSPFVDVYVVLLDHGDPCDRIHEIHTVLEKAVVQYSENLYYNVHKTQPASVVVPPVLHH